MRQSQSNRRGRGRSRKAQNPLTKNYESNGPDVKIRGTASHISEKYNSLARDALAGSDIVRHENYMQHAEHYNRIIMAAQQNAQSNGQAANGQTANGQNVNGAAQGEHADISSGGASGADDGEMKSKGRGDAKKGGRRRRSDNKGQRANGNAANDGNVVEETVAIETDGGDKNNKVEAPAATAEKDADDAAA